MTQQAIDILNRWMAETVRPVPADEITKEATRLTKEFRAYAEDTGLNLEELEIDLGEDLVSHMTDALNAAAEGATDGILLDNE